MKVEKGIDVKIEWLEKHKRESEEERQNMKEWECEG